MKESTVKKNGNAKFVMKNVGCEMRKKKKEVPIPGVEPGAQP